MARPRKWANNAERMAAQRHLSAQATESRVNAHEPDVRIGRVNEQNEPPAEGSVAIEAEFASVYSYTSADLYAHLFVRFRDQPQVPHDCKADPWIGAGRGTVREYKGRRLVLVARGTTDPDAPEHGVVTEADWTARLAQTCEHGLKGWSCHEC